MSKYLYAGLFLIAFVTTPAFGQSYSHEFYLVGDAGAIKPHMNSLWDDLLKQSRKNDSSKTLVFLGDNIYPTGLVEPYEKLRKQGESILNYHIEYAKKFSGDVYFIPGNHDWEQSKFNGLKYIKNQEKFVKASSKNIHFSPNNGCPGPDIHEINNQTMLIVLDTQWWIHPYIKPLNGMNDCDAANKSEFINTLSTELKRNTYKTILVVGHHPIHSSGHHGGFFQTRDSFFPLLNLNKKLAIPMPIIGWIYPTFRRYIGSIQDQPHKNYRSMIENLTKSFNLHERVIYASGHEHSLEYSEILGVKQIVSGSFAKTAYVRHNKHNKFLAQKHGYAVLRLGLSGKTDLEIRALDDNKSISNVFNRTLLDDNKNLPIIQETHSHTLSKKSQKNPSYVDVSANETYRSAEFHKILFGENNRQAWTQKIKVPVFDRHTVKDGLTIDEMGGGMQTRSLKLRDKNGRRYTLRSIKKFTENLLPNYLKNTPADQIVSDQISSSHPYGALAVPKLAKRLNILHTSPKLYYVNENSNLGEYLHLLKNTLCMFEEDLGSSWENSKQFNSPLKIKDTVETFNMSLNENNFVIDQKNYLHARFLDLLIGDWDRHQGQWKWATFKDKQRTIAKPIPEDRDHVFFFNNGAFYKLITGLGFQNKMQSFEKTIKNPVLLAQQARPIDEKFLNQLSWEDWKKEIVFFKSKLSTTILKESVNHMNIQEQEKKEILKALYSRLDNFEPAMQELYQSLALKTYIYAKHSNDTIQIESLSDENLQIIISNKKSNQVYYTRTFNDNLTKEVILHAGDGDDEFIFSNTIKPSISLSLIGGEGQDSVTSPLKENLDFKHTPKIVDSLTEGILIQNNIPYKDLRSKSVYVNEIWFHEPINKKTSFVQELESRPDLGFSISGRYNLEKKQNYTLTPKSKTNIYYAYNLNIKGGHLGMLHQKFSKDSRKSILYTLSSTLPFTIENFFGQGNSSSLNYNKNFHRVRFSKQTAEIHLQKTFANILAFNIGPTASLYSQNSAYNNARVSGLNPSSSFLDSRSHLGYTANLIVKNFNRLGQSMNPAIFNIAYEHQWYLSGPLKTQNFKKINILSRASFSLRPLRSTLNLQLNYAKVFSNWDYYNSLLLGYYQGLPGYADRRFSGNEKFYFNSHLNNRLLTLRNKSFITDLGTSFQFGIGRVWPTASSSTYKRGYLAGIWIKTLSLLNISADYSISEENPLRSGIFAFKATLEFI